MISNNSNNYYLQKHVTRDNKYIRIYDVTNYNQNTDNHRHLVPN